jgi:hypothetical protein
MGFNAKAQSRKVCRKFKYAEGVTEISLADLLEKISNLPTITPDELPK